MTSQEEKEQNLLDKQITQIMLKAERNIKGHNNTYHSEYSKHLIQLKLVQKKYYYTSVLITNNESNRYHNLKN